MRELVDGVRARLGPAGADGAADSATAVPSAAALDTVALRQQLDGRLARLWREPERGRLVIQAVHDSLEAMRETLFPAPVGPARVRAGPPGG